ncbi:carbohydrate esterase family 4 protein [Macroventuria anomochaeta]|uniref:Carbohydrate esterase family 4 protein n=1 Tax=Macroventuria anomochaeta TaxID=301207 RepID=A0ACB6RTS4_9PLEO|nr:carbohydrate esterase family 4 protein [Macroventuria anomochaeta]KAF2625331.1 carbohydrate esterase family 4 protein [Macroventuria anomochaeta]
MYRPTCRLFRLPSKLQRRARRSRVFAMFLLFATIFIFIFPFYCIYKPPNTLIRYFQRRWPDVLWHVPTSQKVIGLTIDDAPSEYTRGILEVLKENEAKATFFVIGGQVPGREGILEDMVKTGMELGNHAMHDEPSRSLSLAQLESEMKQVESAINDTYAALELPRPPKYFRPGSGFFSTRMRAQIKEMGYQMVLGSIYPHDPQIPYPGINARHILSMARPGGIIICHDRRGWTEPMLRKVLPELKRRGYTITTVTGLLEAAGRVGSRSGAS